MTILVYGANGYVGRLLCDRAVSAGTAVVAAGRSDAVGEVAASIGMPPRVGAVDDIDLDGVDVVVNAAGPFSLTAAALARRCVEQRVHYLDLAGEVREFEAVAQLHEAAVTSDVMLMPGTGFGVVPTDCLAQYLVELVPDAVSLDIAFATTGGVSGGTLRSMTANLGDRGHLDTTELERRTIEFDDGPKRCIQNPWRGDLITAPISTGIDAVTTWISVPRLLERAMISAHRGNDPEHPPVLARLLRRLARLAPAGPSTKRLAAGSAEIWASVSSATGASTSATLTTPDAYLHTVDCALAIARLVAGGSWTAGLRTPAQQFGSDFVLEMPGVTRRDR